MLEIWAVFSFKHKVLFSCPTARNGISHNSLDSLEPAPLPANRSYNLFIELCSEEHTVCHPKRPFAVALLTKAPPPSEYQKGCVAIRDTMEI
jgi:hypothetical protein